MDPSDYANYIAYVGMFMLFVIIATVGVFQLIDNHQQSKSNNTPSPA